MHSSQNDYRSNNATPYIRTILLQREKILEPDKYPFCLPVVRNFTRIDLHPNVTFLVGENGSGKSTLLEAIAVAWGFNPEGGSRNFTFSTRNSHSNLSDYLTLVKGTTRPKDGYFLRAESFFNVASEIERLDRGGGGPKIITSYGGKPLHEQSHGESFLALLRHRFRGNGLYLLDEPEAALSVTRQMAALCQIDELVKKGSQFIIATHSPILLAYPNSAIYEISNAGITQVAYKDTEQYVLTRRFLNDHKGMVDQLLRND